jgi:hypothetical protein
MPEAARVGDSTAHGIPLTGAGSSDVLIGNQPAWRALPAGVGSGLEEASAAVKEVMDKPLFMPPEVMPKVPQFQAKMTETAGKAAAAGNASATSGVTSAFTTLTTTATTLTAAYTTAAGVPGGEPAARAAFTMGFKMALSAAMSTAVSAIAGSWDMHACALATPAPHGPGLVTQGRQTVFINNLPAVVKGDNVFEAAGGSVAIQIGCPTVEIDDVTPSSGSGASSTQAKPESVAGAPGPAKTTSKPATTAAPSAPAPASASPAAASSSPVLVYDEQVQLCDDVSGAPVADCAYVVLHGDTVVARGRTDAQGMTERIESGYSEAELTVLWGDDAIARG